MTKNIERLRAALLKFPRRSARKRLAALGISNSTVRRILHKELNFHPYKLAVAQKLYPRDYVARKNACEAFLENLPVTDLERGRCFSCISAFTKITTKIWKNINILLDENGNNATRLGMLFFHDCSPYWLVRLTRSFLHIICPPNPTDKNSSNTRKCHVRRGVYSNYGYKYVFHIVLINENIWVKMNNLLKYSIKFFSNSPSPSLPWHGLQIRH